MSHKTRMPRPVSSLRMALMLLLVVPGSSVVVAAGVVYQVHAEPGNIVVLRNMPARPAVRQMPPSRALMINPSPDPEIVQGLGAAELSNADYAALSAHAPRGDLGSHSGPLTAQIVRDNVQAATSDLLTPTQGGASLGVAGSAIRATTGGIAPTVSDALVGGGLLSAGGHP